MSNVGPFLRAGQAVDLTRYSDKFPMSATQYIRADGGRFVTQSSGTYILSIATSAQLDGWVDEAYDITSVTPIGASTPITTSSTAGKTVLSGTKDIYGVNKAFWMPLKTGLTAAATNIGQLYDLAIEGSTTTTKQVVDTGNNTYKVVKVLDVDLTNNIVLVTAVQKSA